MAHASEVQKRQNADGSVEYSDTPEAGSQPLQLPPVNTVPATPTTPDSSNTPNRNPGQREDRYNSVKIISPSNDQVIHSNQDELPVRLQFDPEFHRDYGHIIEILVDGTVVGRYQDPEAITLTGMVRGSHTIVVRIVDRNGQVLITSESVTVHMKHASILHPKPVH